MTKPSGGAHISIDLDQDGRQDGVIRVPLSSEDVPFGWVETPITSIRRDHGPCVLLIGGCHGDEYEGQFALRRLLASIEPAQIRGQIIVLPAANLRAVAAGRRVSPADNGNLNRAFPGAPLGSPTSVLAHVVRTLLLPRVTRVIDLHSGGRSVAYAPSTMLSDLPDAGRMAEQVALAKVFGLPIAFVVDREDDQPSSLLGTCAAANVLNISAEIGGGAMVSIDSLRTAEVALNRLLVHVGVLSGVPLVPAPAIRIVRRLPVRDMISAPIAGLFEPCVEPGKDVIRGERVGRVYPLDPTAAPVSLFSPRDGLVLCRRVTPLTPKGAGVLKLGVPWP